MGAALVIGATLLGVAWLRRPASTAAATTGSGASTDRIEPAPQWKSFRGTEGYWRIGQTTDGVFWFVSPAGQREFLNTVTTVQPFQQTGDPAGIHFVSRDWDGGIGMTGDLDRWATRTLARVRETGFKGLGAWSNHVFHKYDVPMTRDLNVWQWMMPDGKRLYSPAWQATADRAVREQCGPLRDNRNLVGYFIDNEIDWGDGFAGPAYYFNHLPPTDPNRIEVVKVIREVWPKIEQFNAEWRSELKDWSDLDAWQTLPHPPGAYGRLFSAWLSHLAHDYFRITCGLIREHDPNHLILGVRFRGYAPREVVAASRGFTDAQSINYYVADARFDEQMFRMMHEASGGQPLMITEYSFHALDGRSGNRNTAGFAAQVLDQRARAEAYRLFTLRAARIPFVIGADWFQWSDEPPGGRSSDGEDVNFGVVDVDDHPYEPLVRAIRETATQLNATHADGERATVASSIDTFPWRHRPSVQASAHVPHLERPVSINGELRDWPAEARLPDVRAVQSIGSERTSYSVPTVMLGWRPEGLYVAFEVFDDNVEAFPADGAWWARDHIEFWVSTRPSATSGDDERYDPHCHQFFFVPSGMRNGRIERSIVGQWHRPDDGIQCNLIPHPQIRHASRLLADRYTLELFIPAAALNGWDPQNSDAISFNFAARNFERALDYYWSAGKEDKTELRPATWGNVALSGAGAAPTVAAGPKDEHSPAADAR